MRVRSDEALMGLPAKRRVAVVLTRRAGVAEFAGESPSGAAAAGVVFAGAVFAGAVVAGAVVAEDSGGVADGAGVSWVARVVVASA
jgi:hypothetical protein